MGWKTDLLDAKFRGIPFQVMALADQGSKSLVVHEYPYRSGAAIEDMGCMARVIPIKAVFWGDDYTYTVQNFVQALEQPGTGELIHPVFGSVYVAIKTWEINHTAERPNYAEVNFEAVVSILDESFFQYIVPRSTAEQAVASTKYASKCLIEDASPVCIQTIENQSTTFLNQTNISQQLTSILNAYDAIMQTPRSIGMYVFQPNVFIVDLMAVQQGVVTFASGSSSMAKYIAWSAQFPRLDPNKGVTNFYQSTTYPTHSKYWAKEWVSGGKPGVYTQTPTLPLLDQVKEPSNNTYAKEKNIEATLVTYVLLSQTAICINSVSQMLLTECYSKTPELIPMDIDAIVGVTRMRIQDCLVAVRNTFPEETIYNISNSLRTAAEQIQVLGSSVRNIKPSVTLYKVDCEENIHLLAYRLYGDYRRSRELLRLNPQIQNPNVLPVGQELYIYTDGRIAS